MIDRIQALIDKLDVMRDDVRNKFFDALDLYDPQNGSMDAITWAGRLGDIDLHITKLNLEIKRIEAMEAVHA